MKKRVLMAMMVAVAMLAGCGDDVDSPIIQETAQTIEAEAIGTSETADETTEEAEEGLKVITERTVVDGKMQSYLTGEWKDAEVVQRRNMAVMIPNNDIENLQIGLGKASIIYEAPVEGRITRLMGIFEDYDDLEYLGPIRSSRDYFLYESMAYDSIYVNWGLAVPFVAPIINTDRVDNISQAVSGIDDPAPSAFDRISRPGMSTEFTGMLFIDEYTKAVEKKGYATEYTDRFEQAFTFADEGCKAEYADCPDATKIYPGGKESNKGGYGKSLACFEYNAEDGLYYHSQYGRDHVDENGDPITVSNVVFKICHGEVREPAEKDYLAFGVHGTGDAYVFTNGKVIKGTWQRNSDYEPNLFLDEEGNEIVFNQGKTWICNIWLEYSEFMSWE